MSVHDLHLHVNGQPCAVAGLPAGTLLVDLLREHLRLTGTHVGCDTAQCGACTVLLDGRAVKSCNLLALQAEGGHIDTVEGLASAGRWHPLQQAFSQHHALQCGFCTPGLLMRAEALRREQHPADPARVRQALAGNLCRCTGYQGIVDAVCQVLAADAAARLAANTASRPAA